MRQQKPVKKIYIPPLKTFVLLFIRSILKSLVILVIWLALSCMIYSRFALFFARNHSFCYLLDPFWNHWWSLSSDWLSAVWFIHDSHYFLLEITFVLNRIISVLNRTIFALYRIISVLNTKLDVKAFLFLLLLDPYYFGTDWSRWFQNGSNKVV